MKLFLPLWQRLLVTVVAMLAISYIMSLVWVAATGWEIPAYVSGVIGGLTALPVWELLKRVRPNQG